MADIPPFVYRDRTGIRSADPGCLKISSNPTSTASRATSTPLDFKTFSLVDQSPIQYQLLSRYRGKTLKRLGLSWKKARKLLNKANPKKRAEFLEMLKGLLHNALQHGQMLIYIDEAHIHLDTDEGYGWSIKGERFWVSSSSPGRSKVSFYGVYIYNLGEVRIFPYDTANGLNTIDVLNTLKAEFPFDPMTLIWDGAPYHRSHIVKDAAAALDIKVEPLPGYSPDFMPVEHMQAMVTLRCYLSYLL